MSNSFSVSDLDFEHPGNWYGTGAAFLTRPFLCAVLTAPFREAYHRVHTKINSTADVDMMLYDFNKQRAWMIDAIDTATGKNLGSLKITSK